MNKKNLVSSFINILWMIFIILLPFTSLPLAAKILHASMVAAPSIIIMGLLLITWGMRTFFKNKSLFLSKTILLFTFISILSSLLAFFISIPVFQEFSIIRTELEGIITLLIGVGFYTLISNFINNAETLNKTIRVIAYSMIPLTIWCLVQFLTWSLNNQYPEIVWEIQSYVSTSGNLYPSRITGFAYEPSWLAHILNMFYIPLWFGFVANNTSCFNKRIFKVSFETILLLISIILLIFTKSRVGLVSFGLMSLYFLFLMHNKIVHKINEWINHKSAKFSTKLISVCLVLIYLVSLFFGVIVLSKFDSRMENLLNPQTYQKQNLISIANEFQFAERIMYWQAGWEVFNDYPIFGVGLGNSGFYFEEKLPSFAWALDEPRTLFFRASYLPNNKNLWTKLLSETGIVGFGIFFIWLISILKDSITLIDKPAPIIKTFGLIGVFMFITFISEGFSIDSFALPYFWILPGMVTAVMNFPNLLPNKPE